MWNENPVRKLCRLLGQKGDNLSSILLIFEFLVSSTVRVNISMKFLHESYERNLLHNLDDSNAILDELGSHELSCLIDQGRGALECPELCWLCKAGEKSAARVSKQQNVAAGQKV